MKTFEQVCNDADAIYNHGACNPIGICRALLESIEVGRVHNGEHVGNFKTSPSFAPARLILSQLGYLAGQGIGDYGKVDEDILTVKEGKNAGVLQETV